MSRKAGRDEPDLEVAGLTHNGGNSARNEDDCRLDESLGLFIVADGIGGQPAGHLASRLAVDRIHKSLSHSDSVDIETAMADALLAAHHGIRAAADEDRTLRGMGTTGLILWIFQDQQQAWVAHVGNSRAYHFRAGTLKRLTEDHTLIHAVRQAGMLPDDPDDWPPETVLSQALGSSELIAPAVGRIDILAEDLLVMCTDGVSDVLDDREIAGLLTQGSSVEEMCAGLLEAVLHKGARDNLTAILIRIPNRSRDGSKTTGPRELENNQ